MALAVRMRALVTKMATKYGEAAVLFKPEFAGTFVSGTGDDSEPAYETTAIRESTHHGFANTSQDSISRTFAAGSRVLSGDEIALVSAADLSVIPEPGDGWAWGTATESGDRRQVVDMEAFRVLGTDVAYRVGLKR